MDFLINELKAIYYIVYGVILLGVGMLISDIFTGSIDKLFKKK